jgi:Ala-tRNA(Pro) deacylase
MSPARPTAETCDPQFPVVIVVIPDATTVYERIRALLESQAVSFREVHHPPTRTSIESARARGEELSTGGKAILMKVGSEYRLFVLSASRKIDSRKIKDHFGERHLRFATAEELEELSGLVPGAVPPFGKPVMPFALYVDLSITLNERIAFNAGSLTTSIIMDRRDYERIAQGEVFDFSNESPG